MFTLVTSVANLKRVYIETGLTQAYMRPQCITEGVVGTDYSLIMLIMESVFYHTFMKEVYFLFPGDTFKVVLKFFFVPSTQQLLHLVTVECFCSEQSAIPSAGYRGMFQMLGVISFFLLPVHAQANTCSHVDRNYEI